MLSKIIENIQKIEYERDSALLGAAHDSGRGTMYDRCMSEFSEICEDQIQSAGRILVSKMESAAENERCSLEKEADSASIRKLRSVFLIIQNREMPGGDSLLTSYLDKEIPMKEERGSWIRKILTDGKSACNRSRS